MKAPVSPWYLVSLCENSPYTPLSYGVLPHEFPTTLAAQPGGGTHAACFKVVLREHPYVCQFPMLLLFAKGGASNGRENPLLSSTLLISHYTYDINWRFPYETVGCLLGCSHHVCPFCGKVSISCVWTDPENNKTSLCCEVFPYLLFFFLRCKLENSRLCHLLIFAHAKEN